MGSEDFSFMLQTKPGAYFRLGQGGADSGCVLHNSHFDFNDAVIPLGSAMFCALAERGCPGGLSKKRPMSTAQIKQLTITRPDDWHLHLRDGAALEAVVADTARQFARAIIMPNLKPP